MSGAEACSKIAQELIKELQQRNKVFQKFVETRLLKKSESFFSPITWQNIEEGINYHKRTTTSI